MYQYMRWENCKDLRKGMYIHLMANTFRENNTGMTKACVEPKTSHVRCKTIR